MSGVASRRSYMISPAWLLAPAGLLALAAVGSLPGAAPLIDGMRLLHSGVDYHPDATHSFFLNGRQSVICARNTGIYTGAFLTMLWAWATGRGRAQGFPPLRMGVVLATFVGIMAADGFNSLAADMGYPSVYEPTNPLRLLTGLLAGVAVTAYFLPVVNSLFWREPREGAVLGDFRSLCALLGLLAILWLVVVLGVDAFALPVAGLTTAASLVLFGAVNLLFLVLILKRENGYDRARDLLFPASMALLLSLAQLTLLAWVMRAFVFRTLG